MNSILPEGFSILSFIVFFLVTLVVVFLVMVLFYNFVSLLFRILRKERVNREVVKMHENAYEEALRILDEARVKSARLFGDAQIKSQEMLSETEDITDEKKKELNRKLEVLSFKQEEMFKQLGESLVKSYKEALEKEKNESIKSLAETQEMIKDEVLSNIGDFKDTIRKGTIVAQEQMEEKLKKSYEEVEREIAKYKEEKIAALNAKIFQILADVSEKVFGKSVDQTGHEKFVLDTLKDEVRKLGLGHDSEINTQN
jgi:cell division septum initiation protein DivIVA